MTQLETIKSFLGVQPSFKMAFIGRNDDALLSFINENLEPTEGEINVFAYEDEVIELSMMKITPMADYTKIFRTTAREYELIILNNICFRIENQERLLKTVFKALRNAGNLIIIEDDISGLRDVIESVGFVAINEIETTPNLILLSGKKMHGWGHGL